MALLKKIKRAGIGGLSNPFRILPKGVGPKKLGKGGPLGRLSNRGVAIQRKQLFPKPKGARPKRRR